MNTALFTKISVGGLQSLPLLIDVQCRRRGLIIVIDLGVPFINPAVLN
jgi:hypothetical protein